MTLYDYIIPKGTKDINNCRIDHLHSLKLTPEIPTTIQTMGVFIQPPLLTYWF